MLRDSLSFNRCWVFNILIVFTDVLIIVHNLSELGRSGTFWLHNMVVTKRESHADLPFDVRLECLNLGR